ncbi:hypothetical protein CRUP_018374, partial [Coryphaenoides rupestris]
MTDHVTQPMTQMSSSTISSSSSSSFAASSSSSSSAKLHRVSLGSSRAVDDQCVVVQQQQQQQEQRRDSAVVESFSQVSAREPAPSAVTWERASGHALSPETRTFYDDLAKQHVLKIQPWDFKKMLKKRSVERREERRRPPTEEEMLRILSGADKKDYEKLCAEHGFTDFRGILRKLKEMKKRVDVELVRVLKPLENITGKVRGKEVKRDEKFEVCVSEDGLTYTLKIKDVKASDAGDYEVSVEDLQATVPLVIDRIPLRFCTPLRSVHATERSAAHLACELSCREATVRWLKDGVDVTADPRYAFLREGKRAELLLEDCRLDDEGEFSVVCTQEHDAASYVSSASLTVQERFATVKSDMADVQCPTGGQAELCVALDDEKVEGTWFKDGVEISESLRGVQVVKQGALHKLVFAGIDSGVLDLLSSQPVTVNAGQTATVRIPFRGRPPPKVNLVPGRPGGGGGPEDQEDSGAVMLRLKSSCGTAVANLHLNCIKLRWRAPRDNGGRQITGFAIERTAVEEGGVANRRQAWTQVGQVDGSSTLFFSDLAVQEGRAYRYRPPGVSSQPQVSQVTAHGMTVSWSPPAQDGGAPLLGYTVERRKKGGSLWVQVNQDLVTAGRRIEYEFRVTSVNRARRRDPSSVSSPVLAKDPVRAPGAVTHFSVFDSSSSTISLRWRPPEAGDPPSGYVLEQRSESAREWTKASKLPVAGTSFTAAGLQDRLRYYFRVRGVNEGGLGDAGKLKGQMVIRAGNALRLNLSFMGSPPPTVTWLKDGVRAEGRECITKSTTHSQFLIPSTRRSDSATYRALLHNEFGEAHYDV